MWLYQIWAFIVPGLHPSEKRWTGIFAIIAGPLFLVGVLLGYVTLPKGLEILIGLNPDGLTNLVDFDDYLTFFSRTLLGFGIASRSRSSWCCSTWPASSRARPSAPTGRG